MGLDLESVVAIPEGREVQSIFQEIFHLKRFSLSEKYGRDTHLAKKLFLISRPVECLLEVHRVDEEGNLYNYLH